MDFFKFIQSLDELIYEAVSLLLFYPLTLWRTITSPLRTMEQAGHELAQTDRKQYSRLVPPPLFLLLTLIVIHSVELGTVGESKLVLEDRGFNALIDDDTSLIIFRIVMFSILPLAGAVRLARARGQPLDKELLKPSFYGQCYVASIFALFISFGSILIQRYVDQTGAFAVFFLAGISWLLIVEARWFASELKVGLMKGFGQAFLMLVQWVIVLLLVALVLS